MGILDKIFAKQIAKQDQKRAIERGKLIEEYEKRFAECEVYAEQGDEDSQNRLINWYSDGFRDEWGEKTLFKDPNKAREWVIKAAKSGNTGQQIRFCKMYETGEGCEQDMNKAIECYKECASRKLPVYKQLGFIYTYGNEPPMNHYPPKNPSEAFKWFKLAVDEIGDDESKYELGVLYLEGEGVGRDIAKAKALFQDIMNDRNCFFYCSAKEKFDECNRPPRLWKKDSIKKDSIIDDFKSTFF